jgi:cytochrome c
MKAMLAIRCLVAAASFLFGATAHGAELRGHGGPVRSIAIAPDGQTAITGSFDAKAIIWSLETGEAQQVLLFHESQVDAVAALPQGRYASAGADGRIAIWEAGRSTPVSVLRGHEGPVVALAAAPDGSTLASASWDASVRLWPLSGAPPRILKGHHGNVNAVAFLSDGTLASAGYDATIILWPPGHDAAPRRISMPAPLNALVTMPGDRLLAAGADGILRQIDRSGAIVGEVSVSTGPLIALAVTADERSIAASAIRKGIVLLDSRTLKPVHTLGSAGAAPVWALAFPRGDRTLLAGGADNIISEWDVETGRRLGTSTAIQADLMSEYSGNPDAEVFRACIACHTLGPEDGNRAGPTLHGIFGRRIAALAGYPYSPAFRRMDIVWTPETVSKLFELGPSIYTPGTKMPEQTISDPEDRAALIRFLQAETRRD